MITCRGSLLHCLFHLLTVAVEVVFYRSETNRGNFVCDDLCLLSCHNISEVTRCCVDPSVELALLDQFSFSVIEFVMQIPFYLFF